MLKLSLKQQQRVMIISFLFIPLLLLCVFSFYPATQLFSLSMTDWDGYADVKNYVGFENYQSLLDDPAQLEPFLNTFYYFAGAVIQICLALWFAILVNSKLMGRNLFKTLLFIPFVLNTVAASMVFQIFYQVDGALDNFLQTVGLAGWFQQRSRVVALEPEGAPTLFQARQAGHPVDVAVGGVAADSLGAGRMGQLGWELTQAYVGQSLLLSPAAILQAQAWLWREMRLAVEPAAALPLAALQTGAYVPQPGEKLCLVVCGANVDVTTLG